MALIWPLLGALWFGGLLPEMECLFQTAPQSREAEEQEEQLLRSAALRSQQHPPGQSFPPAPDAKRPPSEVEGFSQLRERAGVQVRVEVSLEQPPPGAELPAEAGGQAQVGEDPGLLGSRGAVEA